jgi:hypothetical protein
MEDILPHYLAIGVSKTEFMKSCPVELKPYDIAHQKQTEEQSFLLWQNGIYVRAAIMSSIGNSPWFKGRGTRAFEYPREPYSFHGAVLTEEEKKREVDKFFAKESARRANWRLTHKNGE